MEKVAWKLSVTTQVLSQREVVAWLCKRSYILATMPKDKMQNDQYNDPTSLIPYTNKKNPINKCLPLLLSITTI